MQVAFPSGDGEDLFLRHRELIKRVVGFVCRRRRASPEDAEEFESRVYISLIENDYDVLRQFQGRSSMRTFLTTVINRLFLDFRVQQWGKWRPTAEAKRLGPLAIELERLLIRDDHTVEEAFEWLIAAHRGAVTRRELEELVGLLPIHPKRRLEGEESLLDVPATGTGADRFVIDEERRLRHERLWAVIAEHLRSLDDQGRLIMTMRFKDGRSALHTSRLLGLNYKDVLKRIDEVLGDLRRVLRAHGIDGSGLDS